MAEHVGELSLRMKRKSKSLNLAGAVDTPLGKRRKTTGTDGKMREDTQMANGHHSLTMDTNDAIKSVNMFPTILHNFRQGPLARQKQYLRACSSLCKRCKNIDLDKLLSTKYKTRLGLRVGSLTDVPTWKVDTCALCNLLSSTLPPTTPDNHIKLVLSAISSKKVHYMGWSSIDTDMLQLIEKKDEFEGRYIVSQPNGVKGPVQIIRANIEQYEIVKNWISLCQTMHTKVCMVKDPSTVRYQKLIDCHTRTIVLAENHPYVALSYVWESNPKGCEDVYDSGKLPKELPRTIEDSITVTRKLSFRYLWVDRYCIDQRLEEEKTYQIGKMDLIYMNAQLTIIAAAGNDSHYGLPGVGHRKREPQFLTRCAKIGRHFLITTADMPTATIVESKWSTRGWTFQEALLSRRRLVFTQEQMYFECYGMYCCESLDFPLEYMHRKDKQGFRKSFFEKDLVGAFPKGIGRTGIEIVRRIEEYTERTLSRSDDILNGMLGIFNAFEGSENSNLKLKHHLGIPILDPTTRAYNRGDTSKQVQGWTPAMGFIVGLCWELEKSAERRPGFPSWSWTGWHSAVKWGAGDMWDWPEIAVDPKVKLSIACTDGQVLSWEDFQASRNEVTIQPQASNIIYIASWTTRIKIVSQVEDPPDGESRYEALLQLDDGGYLKREFKSFLNLDLQYYTGLLLERPFERNDRNVVMLILIQKGDVYQRIGFDTIRWANYERFDKYGVKLVPDGFFPMGNPKYDGHEIDPPNLSKKWKEIGIE